MTYHPTERPIIVKRRLSLGTIVAMLLVVLIMSTVWFVFIADDAATDEIVPADVDVTVDVAN